MNDKGKVTILCLNQKITFNIIGRYELYYNLEYSIKEKIKIPVCSRLAFYDKYDNTKSEQRNRLDIIYCENDKFFNSHIESPFPKMQHIELDFEFVDNKSNIITGSVNIEYE